MMRYHVTMLCGGESMMLSPAERPKIDMISAPGRLDSVLRANKDMVEFMYNDIKLTLYPNGSVMFYHFTDLEVAERYAGEVISRIMDSNGDTMKTEQQIAEDFGQGYDCAMQVAAELAPEVGLTEEQGLKMAACLGVGAMQGQLCGAVIGALMAIGYKYGNTVRGDMATKGACLAKRGEFYERFQKEFGGLTCPELLKLDLRKPEDMEKAKEKKLFATFCPKVCSFAIITAKDIMKD